MTSKKGILQRLAEGPVIGDGSMCMTLEKRGYCTAGPWTPEGTLLYPDAVRQLLREYLRAGADVLQTPCFYSSDGKLSHGAKGSELIYKSVDVNEAACRIAREVANEGDAIVCGGLSPVLSYLTKKGEAEIRKEYQTQLDVFIQHNVDFVLAEFFGHVEDLEICVDVMKAANKPIACTMRIGPLGDLNGISVEECAVRMAKTGADIIGVNCLYDVNTSLKTLKRMKAALDKEGLNPYLMCQPLGWLCPDAEQSYGGYISLPEAPLALDPRTMTRIDAHKFARSAYELGVKYIGGCCGVEPHHIRAFAQELTTERGRYPPVNDMCPPLGKYLAKSMFSSFKKRESNDYWFNLKPATGRPHSSAFSEPQECFMEL